MESAVSPFVTTSSGFYPEGAVVPGQLTPAQGGMNPHNSTPIQAAEISHITNEAVSSGRLWTTHDLARYLGCCEREIRNLRQAGLPAIKFRHLIRFEPETVKQWLLAHCSE